MILRLLAGRRITSAEADALLGALHPDVKPERSLLVRVWEDGCAEPVVHLKLPLSWGRFIAPVFENKLNGLLALAPDFNMQLLQAAVEKGDPVLLAQVRDGGRQMEIRII